MNEESELDEFAPWFLLIITLAGGFLRVFQLDAKGMWLDETFSVWLARQSTGDLLQWIVKIDQHPPLYYLLLHEWVALSGDTPYDVRLLSALFGTATIPIIFLIGRRLAGPVVGLAAAVFLAFSPFNIYYAQEARMYTLLVFNAAVAIYALVRLLTDSRTSMPFGSQFREYVHRWRTAGPVEPDDKGEFSYKAAPPQTGVRAWLYRHRWPPIRMIETDLAWVVFILFSAATLLTHNTAVFFLLATNLFVLGLLLLQTVRKSQIPTALQAPSLANWVKAQIGILLLWSLWLWVFVQQVSRVDPEFWIPQPTWETILQTLRLLLNASAPGQSSQVVVLWLLCLVLGLGLVYFRKKLSVFWFLATLFAVPILGELIVSIRRPIFLDRTLIWVTVPLFLLLAAGIAQLRFRFLMIVMLGIFAGNYLFSTGDYYRFYQKEDWSTAAGYVANFAEKGDLVLFNSNFVTIPFNHYFEQYEDLYAVQVEKRGVPLDLLDDGVLEPKMTARELPAFVSLLRGHDRVWLVYSHDSYTDPTGLIPQTLAAQKELLRQRDFYGGQVFLYGTR